MFVKSALTPAIPSEFSILYAVITIFRYYTVPVLRRRSARRQLVYDDWTTLADNRAVSHRQQFSTADSAAIRLTVRSRVLVYSS